MQYDRADLIEKVAETAEAAVDRGELPREEAQILLKRYEAALEETTYLSRE